MSLRDKMIASIRGRSESPVPTTRAPRPEGKSSTPVPSRTRLPSVESLNRSSHNAIDIDDDGSEKSKDLIIASLKKANAALTTKTAEMEATFMNQCNVLAAEISAQQQVIEEREKENEHLKTKVKSHESQLKEGIQIITALEKEKQFQKQTITDLKNQFFQLQKDIEDKSEEVTLHKDRTREAEQRAHELEKEKNSLVYKVDETCMDRDRIKAEFLHLQRESENGISSSVEVAIQDNNDVVTTIAASSPSSVQSNASEVRQNWRQLEEKKEQLDSALSLLHETQSGLATLEHKHKDLQKQFDDKLLQRYDEIKSELQKETDELKSTIHAKDDTIANLHERLESYNDDLTKAEDEVDRLSAEIDNQRLKKLKEELEDIKQQLKAEKDLNSDLSDKYDDLSSTVEHLEKETQDLRVNSVDEIIGEKDTQIQNLEHELNIFRSKLGEEKKQGEMLLNIKVSRINELERELMQASITPDVRLEQLTEENAELKEELDNMGKELDDAIEANNKMEEEMRSRNTEQLLPSARIDDYDDFVKNLNMSTNSIGVVNDAVVTRLKSDITDMEEDHDFEMKELEVQMSKKDNEILDLQSKMKNQSTELSTIKMSYEDQMSTLRSDIDHGKESLSRLQKDLSEKETIINDLTNDLSNNNKQLKALHSEVEQERATMKEKNLDIEDKENRIKTLKTEVAKLLAIAEQKKLDHNEDMKVLEESWRSAKSSLLQEKTDVANKLAEAMKENTTHKEALRSIKLEKEQLLVERKELKMKMQSVEETSIEKHASTEEMQQKIDRLVKQIEQYDKSLDEARKESDALKEQINDLEWMTSDQEKKLETYQSDIARVDELKSNNEKLQKELDTVKLKMMKEKEEYENIVASLKSDGKKRGDKLKIIELNEQLHKLRTQLRHEQSNDGEMVGKYKHNSVKKVYNMARDTHHKKEMSDLEDKLKSEIEELKDKLSDRDTTITATLRSSVLQDQKINTLQERIKMLQDTKDLGPLEPDALSAPTFDELNNLRESVQNHEETQKSLSYQIKTLKRQLSEAKQLNNSGVDFDVPSSKLEKQLEDYKTKVKERDGAIQSLVKSSITQEQQIAALRDELADMKLMKSQNPEAKYQSAASWKEIERLQQESEIFAGQIIEQDEEIEDLRRLLDDSQNHSTENGNLRTLIDNLRDELDDQLQLRDEERSNKRTMSEAIKMELEEEKRKRENQRNSMNRELEAERAKREKVELELMEVTSKVGRREKQDLKLTKLKNELEQVEEANDKLQSDVRDLRRKLRVSQHEAERVNDLEMELEESKQAIKELRKSKSSSKNSDEYDMLESEAHSMRTKLQIKEEECIKAQERCRKLEEEIAVCRKEKDGFNEEFLQKQRDLQQSEQTLRDELNQATQALSDIEAKLNRVQQSETRLRGEVEALRALKEVAINEKDHSASKAIQEIAAYKTKIGELQYEYENQNDVIASLTDEVKLLRNTQIHHADSESTEIIAALSAEVKKLRNENLSKNNNDGSTEIIVALTEEVKKMRYNQGNNDSGDVIDALTQEVKRLHLVLKQQTNHVNANEIERVIRSEVEQEMQSIRSQKDYLGKENLNLQSKLDEFESDRKKISTMKKQVDEAEKSRTLFEKTMISTYERKLNLMQMNKDLTIDGLRKELTQGKETLKEMESDLLNKIRSLEAEKNEIEAELKAKMQHKNAKIKFLEQTLKAHEQVAGHMKDELDQLQNGMESVSVTRRAELEELQEELMAVQSKAAKYEREIAALKMKLDDQRAYHENEMSKLHYQMEEMRIENDDSPSIRQLAEKDRMAVNEMSKQVEALRSKVSTLQMENFDLREKIDRDETSSRSSKNDKWRNSALQEQVQVLTRRLRELEGDDSSMMSSSTRRSKRSSRRIPTTPRGPGTSSKRAPYDDISTRTENTC